MIWTAFLLGFAGSLHCAGMCGPIALALPLPNRSAQYLVLSRILYNFGRIFTYVLLGALFGLLGEGLFLAGGQKVIAMVAGAALLFAAVGLAQFEYGLFKIPLFDKMIDKVKQGFGYFYKRPGYLSVMGLGVLNGLLPCGLVYVAIAGAMATGTTYYSALFMLVFGLGTAPMMFGIGVSRKLFTPGMRKIFRKVAPLLFIGFAVFTIYRGWHAEIPRDFRFWILKDNPIMCH